MAGLARVPTAGRSVRHKWFVRQSLESHAVVADGHAAREGARDDARHVPQEHLRPVGVGAHDDPAELLGCDEPALRLHGIRELGPCRGGRPANLAGGDQDVLLLVDDPAAELDRDNRGRLFQMLEDMPAQMFVTALEAADLPWSGQGQMLHIEGGEVASLL